jgi:hypothetical protein
MNSPRPYLLSVMTATLLINFVAVWLATYCAHPTMHQTYQPSSPRHFQISPIPPGVDWTS